MTAVEIIDLKGIHFKVYSKRERLLFFSIEFAQALDISHKELEQCLVKLTFYKHLERDKDNQGLYFGILEFFELFFYLKNFKTTNQANQTRFDQFLKASIDILVSYQLGLCHPLFEQFDKELTRYKLLTLNFN